MYPAQTAPYAAAKLAERLREAELARQTTTTLRAQLHHRKIGDRPDRA